MKTKNTKTLPARDLEEITQQLLETKDARKNSPSPTAVALKQAENLSRMLHSSYREIAGLQQLEEIEGLPGFEGLEGLAGLEGFDGFDGLSSIQAALNEQPVNVLTLVRLIGLERGQKPGQIEKNIMRDHYAKIGKVGAAKRHKPGEDLKAWTLEKFRAGKWHSTSQAALDLKDQVIAHGRTINIFLTETNAQRTITGWISKYRRSL
jgi:hypothetical protein